jgi:hypothetical protein
MTYILDETGRERVGDGRPALRTWSYRRAMRRRNRLNGLVAFPSYRWEVVKDGNRWDVIAFQNYLREEPKDGTATTEHGTSR